MQTKLLNNQINELARPLIKIISDFYANPENEKKYQEWKSQQEVTQKKLGGNYD